MLFVWILIIIIFFIIGIFAWHSVKRSTFDTIIFNKNEKKLYEEKDITFFSNFNIDPYVYKKGKILITNKRIFLGQKYSFRDKFLIVIIINFNEKGDVINPDGEFLLKDTYMVFDTKKDMCKVEHEKKKEVLKIVIPTHSTKVKEVSIYAKDVTKLINIIKKS